MKMYCNDPRCDGSGECFGALIERPSAGRSSVRHAVRAAIDEARAKSLALRKAQALYKHERDMERYWVMLLRGRLEYANGVRGR